MRGRRWSGIGMAGALVVLGVAGFVAMGSRWGRTPPATRPESAAFDANTPLEVLAPALRESDARALTALERRLASGPEKPAAVGDVEAKAWLETLSALRTGYLKFGGFGRASTATITAGVLARFAVEEAPSCWPKVLVPAHDLLGTALVDPDPGVRVAALEAVGRLWVWMPGASPTRLEEVALADWKDGFFAPVVRCLAHPAARVRVAAVACLGYHPVDRAAGEAIASLDDTRSGDVRRQVLISFARRPDLLSDDAILKRLYDPEPVNAQMAELILKTRGLNSEQVSLGKMIYHPKPELRASVIPLLRNRTDIDPVVWLIELSRDSDANVRAGAVAALAGRLSPEVRRRLAEMARSDKSPAVRQAASKIVPPNPEKTVALPPLPGSPSLNPKAN